MTNIFDEHLPPLPQATEADFSRHPRSNKRRMIEGIGTAAIKAGVVRLQDLAALAFETLEDAMRNADHNISIQAAKIVLDRSGFGASQTLKIDDTPDLSGLSREEIRALALAIAQRIDDGTNDSDRVPEQQVH